MANQEMYKHDAMLHMVWSVAQADTTPGNETNVTKQEDSYLDVVRNYEKIKIDWDDFNAKRKHLKHDYISETIQYDGETREYGIYVPAIYDRTTPTPLIFS